MRLFAVALILAAAVVAHGVAPQEEAAAQLDEAKEGEATNHELSDRDVELKNGHVVVTEYTDSDEDVEALIQLSKDKQGTSQFPEVNKLEANKGKNPHANTHKHM